MSPEQEWERRIYRCRRRTLGHRVFGQQSIQDEGVIERTRPIGRDVDAITTQRARIWNTRVDTGREAEDLSEIAAGKGNSRDHFLFDNSTQSTAAGIDLLNLALDRPVR